MNYFLNFCEWNKIERNDEIVCHDKVNNQIKFYEYITNDVTCLDQPKLRTVDLDKCTTYMGTLKIN